jgi:hypothetical protein
VKNEIGKTIESGLGSPIQKRLEFDSGLQRFFGFNKLDNKMLYMTATLGERLESYLDCNRSFFLAMTQTQEGYVLPLSSG